MERSADHDGPSTVRRRVRRPRPSAGCLLFAWAAVAMVGRTLGIATLVGTLWAFDFTKSVAPDLGNLTATAVLAWYAWYTATRTMPGLMRAFREEMHAAREDFRNETAAQRDQLACEREYRHRDNAAIARALNRLSRATARLTAQVERDEAA